MPVHADLHRGLHRCAGGAAAKGDARGSEALRTRRARRGVLGLSGCEGRGLLLVRVRGRGRGRVGVGVRVRVRVRVRARVRVRGKALVATRKCFEVASRKSAL